MNLKTIIRHFRNKRKESESKRESDFCLLSSVPDFFKAGEVLAHAGGGYQGYSYLNCKEGLEEAIANGYKAFEVDVTITDDGYAVLSHGWSEKMCGRTGMEYKPEEFKEMTRDKFLAQTVRGYTTMDFETLVEDYIKKYPDTYWELDLQKHAPKDAKALIEAVLKAAGRDEAVLDRLLIQVFSPEMHKAIHEVYPFKNYMCFYKKENMSVKEAISFCKEKNIGAVALNRKFATKEMIVDFRKNQIAVLAFTTDKKEKAQELLDWGASIICTNKILPGTLKGLSL
ncbi:glycerophosphodiester phosphodiesterase family protein [Eubacterium oxidoreducens]|uniref:Glycerophosphoryl diester phosphodiesterase n=1 Tax=Eubacterium oxidoreducens TaxID=1732 RepID=A0A1G6BDC6_EUBOX|nr:glycerophosphodiester phosphodiesterase family protein [Eubacterium oxidoreducens]SDB18605.1 Glycerophosphoryl diester phosphodiesterase [Eubacterium oxidoreducens]